MIPSEEILKFKTGEKVTWAENFTDRRLIESIRVKEIRQLIQKNCKNIKESLDSICGYYTLKISGIKI